jgi:hypothetical protein
MDMRYVDVDELLKIFKKLAATIEVIPRWEIAKRMKVLKSIMEPVNEARNLPESIKEYNTKQERIFEKYGTPVPAQNGGVGYRIDDWGPVNDDISKLKEENKEILEQEIKRRKDIEFLLNKEISIDIEPIDYEWCGELINGNDLVMLMEFDLVNDPKDEEEIESDNEAKIRNIRNQKKRSRKK